MPALWLNSYQVVEAATSGVEDTYSQGFEKARGCCFVGADRNNLVLCPAIDF